MTLEFPLRAREARKTFRYVTPRNIDSTRRITYTGRMTTNPPDRIQVLELAAKACCDVRSAHKYLSGEVVRGLAGERLRRADAEMKAAKKTAKHA